jgi:hypothetical protein
MNASRLIALLVMAAFATPALAVPAVDMPKSSLTTFVQDKAEEHGKKNAKGKAKHDDKDKKDNQRSNKGGETRGKDRSDQVQGMQDTGKGGSKRP